jgi:predicted nucleotidyltransferase
MRTKSERLKSLDPLFGKTKQAILGLLFGGNHEEYHLREIARHTGISQGALTRELTLLSTAGLITREKRGNQVIYRANRHCPVYDELRGLVLKTIGLAGLFRDALDRLSERIQVAFIYGSIARGDEKPDSDVDLLVVGDVKLRDVVKALGNVREKVGREMNPSVYTLKEYRDKLAHGHHFLTSLKNEPKIFLIGSEDEFGKLG